MSIWSIDGIGWTIPCQIKRMPEVKGTEISGFMMDGAYFNDVMGTYMRYEVAIAVPLGMRDQYYDIFEKLSEPVGYHTFVFPYNGDTVTFTGRVDELSDEYVWKGEDDNWWKGVRFTAISNTPTKVVDAEGLVNYGVSPFPMSSEAEIGTIAIYTESGWSMSGLPDADEEYF